MTTKPDFTLEANGTMVTDQLVDRVAKLEVIQHSGLISDYCILTLDDHRRQRIEPPKPGDSIRIAMGYQDAETLTHQGEFDVAEYSLSGSRDTLTVYGNKLLWSKDFKAPKQLTWESLPEAPLTLHDLLSTVASHQGLSARVADQYRSIVVPTLHQSESDAQLITRLASLYDATARVVENYLIFVPRGSGKSRSGQTLDTVDVDYHQLTQWQLLDSEQTFFRSCKASYHNVALGERKIVTAGSGAPCFELPLLYADEMTAAAASEARLNDFFRTERRLQASCVGSPQMMAGGLINITNVRDGIDGEWCLTHVHQVIDVHGFMTHFTAKQLST